MARKREGRVDRVGARFRARLSGEYLGLHDDEQAAWDRVNAAIALDTETAPLSLRRWGADWLDQRELDGHIKNIRSERSVWRSRVESAAFIDWPLKRIRPRDVQSWLRGLLKRRANYTLQRGTRKAPKPTVLPSTRKLSRQSVVHALRLVTLCIDDAVLAGKLASNPARLAKLPKQKTEMRDGELVVHASKAEIAALFALELEPIERAIFSVAIFVGLREGEIWGLRWQDVLLDGAAGDGARPCVRVRRSYEGPPKSRHGIRDVPLLEPARDALRAYKRSLSPAPIAGLVFPADHGGCHYEGYAAGWPDKRERRGGDKVRIAKGIRTRAKIRDAVTFQCLRHTCGCHLVQGSWTDRPLTLHEVKAWLGHSSILVTERHYAALVSGNLHDAVGEKQSNFAAAIDKKKST